MQLSHQRQFIYFSEENLFIYQFHFCVAAIKRKIFSITLGINTVNDWYVNFDYANMRLSNAPDIKWTRGDGVLLLWTRNVVCWFAQASYLLVIYSLFICWFWVACSKNSLFLFASVLIYLLKFVSCGCSPVHMGYTHTRETISNLALRA